MKDSERVYMTDVEGRRKCGRARLRELWEYIALGSRTVLHGKVCFRVGTEGHFMFFYHGRLGQLGQKGSK